MLTRRGFFGRVGGALAAAIVLPRSLFTRAQPVTLGLSGPGTYRYKYTFVTASGETPPGPVRDFTQRNGDVIARRLYTSGGAPDGQFRFVGDVPPNVSGWRTGINGSYFIDSAGRRI